MQRHERILILNFALFNFNYAKEMNKNQALILSVNSQ